MVRRSETECQVECDNCPKKRYSNSYNVEMKCDYCKECEKREYFIRYCFEGEVLKLVRDLNCSVILLLDHVRPSAGTP